MAQAQHFTHSLACNDSICFKVSPFIKADDRVKIPLRLNERYGGSIPLSMSAERVVTPFDALLAELCWSDPIEDRRHRNADAVGEVAIQAP